MSTPLPTHLGGYQQLEPDVTVAHGDIWVKDGEPAGDCVYAVGWTVREAEERWGEHLGRIYRKIPVPTQSGDKAGPLPADAKARKGVPIYSGFIKYFPLAIAAVARLSQVGNDQHNPGQPLHWDRSKSGDELDALARHLVEAESTDTDGVDHLTKVAWRAMAALQKRLEKDERQA